MDEWLMPKQAKELRAENEKLKAENAWLEGQLTALIRRQEINAAREVMRGKDADKRGTI